MKKNVLLGVLVLSCIGMTAQETVKETKETTIQDGKVKVMMVKDVNGNVTKTEETFNIDDGQSMEEVLQKLKAQGIDINVDGGEGKMKFIHINGTEGLEGKMNSEIRIIKLDSSESNSFSNEMIFEVINEKLEGEMIDAKTIDEIKNKVMEVRSEIRQTDGEHQNVIIRTKVIECDDSLKTDDLEKVEMILNEFTFDIDNSWVSDEGVMVFFKQDDVKVIAVEDLPVEINQEFDPSSNIDKLKLFPNPADGEFNMQFTSKDAKDYQLSIKDAKGSVIYEKQLNGFEGQFNETFDLSQYESGLYLFNLNSEGEQITKKIIVK